MSKDAILRSPEQFPGKQASLRLQGLAGELEAISDLPEPGEDTVSAVAIICHPRTEDGGTLHSKVVQMMERSLREMGLKTVRFNFRGVGASAGEFDKGSGETDDLLSVAAWVRQTCPDDEIWLAGYGQGKDGRRFWLFRNHPRRPKIADPLSTLHCAASRAV